MNKKLRNRISLLVAVAILAGCGSPKEDKFRTMSANQLLTQGKEHLSSGNYVFSVEHFDLVEARFPYSNLAEQAKLNKIYAFYGDRKHDEALAEIDSFVTLYPNHPHVDYAWYMRGVINFDRARSILDKLLPPDRTRIDSKQLTDSLNAFLYVVENYPDGPYAEDSAKRAVYLRNLLAQSEIHIANFYYERDAYIGAANRAQYVLDNYDETPSLADALYIQVKAYRKLGMDSVAEDRLRIFRHNFPEDNRLHTL